MIRIESTEQYKSTVRQAKESGCLLSNCFFLPAAVEQKITERTLFFSPIENGLLLLDDRIGFFRCYYFLASNAHYPELSLSKDAVIEFPFQGEFREKQYLQEEKIKELGFLLGRESGMMCASAESITLPSDIKDNTSCGLADQEDGPAVLRLINKCFNPMYAFLPDAAELRVAIDDDRVLVWKDQNTIAGALLCEFKKGIASINQIAVEPAYRGKGIGKTLLNEYHIKYIKNASSFQHWVDLHNNPAVQMYSNVGYQFNLRKANEYIKLVRRNENE